MERNAHRLALHSPAREIVPDSAGRHFDFAQYWGRLSGYSHLLRFSHHATPTTSSTSNRQKVAKP
ncbi:hypothetical protein C1N62_08055 [Nissabacter sp. SGAir0207]|nr:hypothetical protein C1N62_08055 [Nissabacter sp. SGAir0207]